MSRRRFVGAALATVGLGVATVGVVRAATAPANAAPGGLPGAPQGHGLGNMIVRDPNGGYMSHLLPFAAPFPTAAAAAAEIEKGRKLGLFR
jgi:hypothetical protein